MTLPTRPPFVPPPKLPLDYAKALSIGFNAGALWICITGCIVGAPISCCLVRDEVMRMIPIGAVILLGVIVGGFTTFGNLRTQRDRARRKLGLCIRCGYDCRSNFSRCPECGGPLPDKME